MSSAQRKANARQRIADDHFASQNLKHMTRRARVAMGMSALAYIDGTVASVYGGSSIL
jgi:hypothetical protein